MRTNTIMGLSFIMLAAILSLWGCPKSTNVSSSPLAQNGEPSATAAQNQDAKTGGTAGTASNTNADSVERSASASGGLQPIHFDYDQSVIHAEARNILAADAQWLKANPKVKVTIEGNCDERGTVEYNQALGQRRAVNARKVLTDLGIASDRITLLSFGKERPLCNESVEVCWQKNRRDDFVAIQ